MPAIEPIKQFNVADLADWLWRIPLPEWPGMADPQWHGWLRQFADLALNIAELFPVRRITGLGLFLLAPGQEHPAHTDVQPPDWLTRVHVPIVTNPDATATTDDGTIHMQQGMAYRFDTRATHAVRNGGTTPRVHFICDIKN